MNAKDAFTSTLWWIAAILIIAAVFLIGAETLPGLPRPAECDQDPYCEKLAPSDEGEHVAPGPIVSFEIKAGQNIIAWGQGTNNSDDPLADCWNVVVTGDHVEWERLEESSRCQDPSVIMVWWQEEEPTATPEDTATPVPSETPTATEEATSTSTATSTAEATATSTSTTEPTSTSTSEPTETPEASPTSTSTTEPTKTPEASSTPTATATKEGDKTPTPTVAATETPEVEEKLAQVRVRTVCDANGSGQFDSGDFPVGNVEVWFGLSWEPGRQLYPTHQDVTSEDGWTSNAVGRILSVDSVSVVSSPYPRLGNEVWEIRVDNGEWFPTGLPFHINPDGDVKQLGLLLTDCVGPTATPKPGPEPGSGGGNGLPWIAWATVLAILGEIGVIVLLIRRRIS